MADRKPLVPVGTAPNFTAIGELLAADRLAGVINEVDLSPNSVATKNNAGVVTPTTLGNNTILGNIGLGTGIEALDQPKQRILMNALYSLTTTGEVLAYDSVQARLVKIPPGTNGQALIYASGEAGGLEAGDVASELDALSDVSTSAEADGHVLRYNTVAGEYLNAFLNISDLGDVDLTSGPDDGDVLQWDTDTWVSGPVTVSAGVTTAGEFIPTPGTNPLDMNALAITAAGRIEFAVGLALFPSVANNNWGIAQGGSDLLIAQTPHTGADYHFAFKDDDTLRLYKYGSARDDSATVTNYLCTDANGVLKSNPVADLEIPAELGDLTDVDLVSNAPTNGQVLTYVSADSEWVAATPTAAQFINLADGALDMAQYNINNVGTLEFRDYGASKWTIRSNEGHTVRFAYGASLYLVLDSLGNLTLPSYGSGRANDAITLPMDNILYTSVSGGVAKANLGSLGSSGAGVTSTSMLYINSSNVLNKLSMINLPTYATQALAAAGRTTGELWAAADTNYMGVPPGTLMTYKAGTPTMAIRTIRQLTGATNNILLADAGKYLEVSHGSATDLIIPANADAAIPVGTLIKVIQTGVGTVTIEPAVGVTLEAFGDVYDLSGEWGEATLLKRGTNSWLMSLDTSAAGLGTDHGSLTGLTDDDHNTGVNAYHTDARALTWLGTLDSDDLDEGATNLYLTGAERTKLTGIEAAADVTDATNVDAAGAVMNTDYNAHTILQATSDNTPVALTVAEQRLVGRITGGNITALTGAEILTLIGVEANADVTDATNVDAAGGVMITDYNAQTILVAVTNDTPVPLTIPEQTIVGRVTGGDVDALTSAEVRNVASKRVGAYVVGQYYALTSQPSAFSLNQTAMTADRSAIYAWTAPYTFTPASLGVYVVLGIDGSLTEILVYEHLEATGWPGEVIYNSGGLVTGIAQNGTYVADSTSLPTFQAGVTYWIGVLSDEAVTLRSQTTVADSIVGHLATVGATTSSCFIAQTSEVIGSPSDPYVFSASDLTTGNTPIVIALA